MTIRPNTKDAIIEAAFQLFKTNPNASLAEIAEYAGVGRATLHRYFAGRDDLSLALAKLALAELDTVADDATKDADSYTEALRLMLFALVPLADRQWFLANANVDTDPEIEQAYHQQNIEMLELIEQAKAEGSVDQQWPSKWVVSVYSSLLYAAWDSVSEQELTEKQAAELAWNTFQKAFEV